MKTKIYTILGLLILMVLHTTSCNDFLDKKKHGEQTEQNFYQNENDALKALNATYSQLRHLRYASSLFTFGDILSDDAIKGGSGPSDGSYIQDLKEFRQVSTNYGLFYLWFPMWQGIYRANTVLTKTAHIKSPNMPRILAEAKFLRAYYYSQLVRAFGGMPLLEQPLQFGEYEVKRATIAATYKFIEDDLIAVKDVLPKKSEYNAADMGRATSGAAYALLGKIYLYQKKYLEAKKAFEEVIISNEYNLEPDYEFIFSLNGENCSESVFEIQFTENPSETEAYAFPGNFSTVYVMPRATTLWGWGFDSPTQDLVDEYEANDPRKTFTIINYGDVIDGEVQNFDTNNGEKYFQKKNFLKKSDRPASFRNSPVNFRIIRYADVYLMYAEACANSSEAGSANLAVEYLNKVRKRARDLQSDPNALPDFGTPEYNNSVIFDSRLDGLSDIMKAIIHERRVELAMEYHRFWDLVRWGLGTKFLHPNYKDVNHDTKGLFLIPQGDIDLSNGTLMQND